MRMLEVIEEGALRANAAHHVIARMVYPDDDISAEQVIAVMHLEIERKARDPRASQGDIMQAVEGELIKHQTLGRMAGDVALKMVNERSRGGNPSLEYASTFVSNYYAEERTPEQSYPTQVVRLQNTVRRFRNSIHYWAAWQLCRSLDGFDFLRDPGNLWQLLLQAGMVQITLRNHSYFRHADPWLVPIEFIQSIELKKLLLTVPEETDFESEFAETYRSKIGR